MLAAMNQGIYPMRLASRLLLALLFTALLAGCFGGTKKMINPPRASLQELVAQANGQWRLTVRLQNFSNVPTTFDSVRAKLVVSGQDAGAITLTPALTIGPESADIVSTTISPALLAKATLASALSAGRPVRYTLSGRINTHDPKRDDEFSYESTLNPAPGLTGVMR